MLQLSGLGIGFTELHEYVFEGCLINGKVFNHTLVLIRELYEFGENFRPLNVFGINKVLQDALKLLK